MALTSLYEVTQESKYLNYAVILADWCINKTETDYGFTGGYTGWGASGQDSITWKSTEHNIDLYALFLRLFETTNDSAYYFASENAKDFVLSMWNPAEHHFWTGTDNTGIDINEDVIPLDIQAWYIMAFKDSTSQYIAGIDWAKQNCYLENFVSPNYAEPINGFDFNTDKDGIWFEGSSQAALASKMIGNIGFADSILLNNEYVQDNHINPMFYNWNDKGIVAADHNHLSTGFDWEYHNRLHIGATCWYIFAKLGCNPYYYPFDIQTGIDNHERLKGNNNISLLQNYPNPFKFNTEISFYLPEKQSILLEIFNMQGQKVKTLLNKNLFKGNHSIVWNGTNDSNNKVHKGIYLYKLESGNKEISKKMLKLN